MILNGELTLWQPATEPFVYQDIHTLGLQCRYTQRHIDFLNIAGNNLFGKKLNASAETIELHIRDFTQLYDRRKIVTRLRRQLSFGRL